MAIFPELIPSTRTYSPGAFPHTAHDVYDGTEARVRHSNTVLGVRLRLFFPALSTADLLLVIAHYNGQRGRFLPFAIPDQLLSGVDTPADFTPSGYQWRYAAKPTAQDISIVGGTNRHDLTIELETMPPENTIAQGARLRARASLQPGNPQLGKFFDAFTLLDAGAAGTRLDLSATVTFEPGSPFPVVAFDVVATLSAGAFSAPAELELPVTATMAAGAASSGVTDPDFSSVELLLPMNGSNGSTTFTDASTNAFTVTATGNAQISTTQSKWGGASGSFDGTGDVLTVPDNAALRVGSGDFTIELWFWLDASIGYDRIIALKGGTYPGWMLYYGGVGELVLYASSNGTSWNVAQQVYFNGNPTRGVWHHIAIARSSGEIRGYFNGTRQFTVTTSATLADATDPLCIGASSAGAASFKGYVDDFRLTKGVARYTGASLTVPTAPFPTS